MYLPKHQFKKTQVSEIFSLPGFSPAASLVDAVGNIFNKTEIVVTSEGELYDVSPEDLEKGIFTNATQIFPPPVVLDPSIPSSYVEPTDSDKQACMFKRYFTKNKSNGKIKELTKADYQEGLIGKKNYELFAKTDWNLCGPLSDQEINGYFLEGTASKNKKLVDELEKKIPGIKDILTDYGQFVDDKTPPAPAPKASTKITVPAPSK